jgi:hypothetical protein
MTIRRDEVLREHITNMLPGQFCDVPRVRQICKIYQRLEELRRLVNPVPQFRVEPWAGKIRISRVR